jgi:hypothetical protein
MNTALFPNHQRPEEVIVLPDSVYHSYLGEYFLGQTETIGFGGVYYAWGGLVNPTHSGVSLFLNAYTISNFSLYPVTAEGWLSSNLAGKPSISQLVAAGNQAKYPPSMPKVLIESVSYITEKPKGGTYTFVRRVEPNQTLAKHDFQGMYIIPPGSSFVLFFMAPEVRENYVRIAFGWWEEKISEREKLGFR